MDFAVRTAGSLERWPSPFDRRAWHPGVGLPVPADANLPPPRMPGGSPAESSALIWAGWWGGDGVSWDFQMDGFIPRKGHTSHGATTSPLLGFEPTTFSCRDESVAARWGSSTNIASSLEIRIMLIKQEVRWHRWAAGSVVSIGSTWVL